MVDVPTNDSSLAAVKIYLREHVDDGVPCPACSQTVQLYKRKITRGVLEELIAVFRAGGTTRWVELADLKTRGLCPTGGTQLGKASYFGVVEQGHGIPDGHADGAPRGWWRVTRQGEDWIRGRYTIPHHTKLVFDGGTYGEQGGPWTVEDAYKEPFDLQTAFGEL